MPIETAADRATFTDIDEFAVAATYIKDGVQTTVNGIFDQAFALIDVEAGAAIGSTTPQFHCVSSDLPAGAAQCDRLIIAGITYQVSEIEPDGTGMTMLMLDKL